MARHSRSDRGGRDVTGNIEDHGDDEDDRRCPRTCQVVSVASASAHLLTSGVGSGVAAVVGNGRHGVGSVTVVAVVVVVVRRARKGARSLSAVLKANG